MVSKEVRYICRQYRDLKLYKEPTYNQIVTDANGVQRYTTIPPVIVQFENYEYKTDDAQVIEWLDKHPRMTGIKARKCIERASEIDVVKNEIVALVNEVGEAKTLKLLQKLKAREAAKNEEVEEEEVPRKRKRQ